MRRLVVTLAIATVWGGGCIVVSDQGADHSGSSVDAGQPPEPAALDAGQVTPEVGCPARPICTTSDGLSCDSECLEWGTCCRCLGGTQGVADVGGAHLDETSCLVTVMSGDDIDVDPYCFNDLCRGVCSEVFGEVEDSNQCSRFGDCFAVTFPESTDYPDDPSCRPLEVETNAAVICSREVFIATDAAPTCLKGSAYCEDLYRILIGCMQGLAARFGVMGLGQSGAKTAAIEGAIDRYRHACGDPDLPGH